MSDNTDERDHDATEARKLVPVEEFLRRLAKKAEEASGAKLPSSFSFDTTEEEREFFLRHIGELYRAHIALYALYEMHKSFVDTHRIPHREREAHAARFILLGKSYQEALKHLI